MNQAVQGAVGFIVAALVAVLLGLGWQHYQLVSVLKNVLNNNCAQVEKSVIDAAVTKALAEGEEKGK